MGVLDQVEAEVEALEEPDHDRRDQNDREGALQEISGFFPEKLGDILGAREAVVRELHDERDGFALEEGLLEEEGRQDGSEDAQNIEARDDEPALLREERVHEEPVDRKLGCAGHKGREQDRHAAVALAGQGPGGHDRRDRAAEA